MSLLVCPFCGSRPIDEFVFHKTLPNVAGGAFETTYLRDNEPAASLEHWQHVYGCRAWLLLRRNPSTGEVHETRLLTGASR